MSKSKTTIVNETNIGIYVWEMPDGRWVGDGEGNFMNISSMRGDLDMMAKLADAARAHGVMEGGPRFVESRRVTDEEYQIQLERLHAGQMPDQFDLGNLIDEHKKKAQKNG